MNEKQRLQPEWRDYWDMIVRRRWVLLGAFFMAGLIGTVAAALWPVRYRSEALILVDRQGVPSDYVRPNVVGNVQQQLQSITQLVLSRTRLKQLITKYHLYTGGPGPKDVDSLVRRMRKDIQVEPILASNHEELTAFRVSFIADTPTLAQEVNNDLTAQFINRSLESQTQQSVATTSFLKSELDAAAKQLSQAGQALQKYKTRYLGELPEQQPSNVNILSGYEAQLYAETNALDRSEEQRVYLQTLLSTYKKEYAPSSTGALPGATRLEIIDKMIHSLQAQLANLEAEYTPKYPEVEKVKANLKGWEQRRKEALETSADPTKAKSKDSAVISESNAPALVDVEGRLESNKEETAYHERQIKALKEKIGELQARLRVTPLREQQLEEVTRNYQNAQAHYQQLLKKQLQSQLATSLVEREQGERFRMVDPPSLPRRPALPNRLEIVLSGWAVGLGAALGMVAIKETTDDRVRGAADVQELVPLPILARVPVLLSPSRARRVSVLKYLEIIGIIVLALAAAGFGLYVCRVG